MLSVTYAIFLADMFMGSSILFFRILKSLWFSSLIGGLLKFCMVWLGMYGFTSFCLASLADYPNLSLSSNISSLIGVSSGGYEYLRFSKEWTASKFTNGAVSVRGGTSTCFNETLFCICSFSIGVFSRFPIWASYNFGDLCVFPTSSIFAIYYPPLSAFSYFLIADISLCLWASLSMLSTIRFLAGVFGVYDSSVSFAILAASISWSLNSSCICLYLLDWAAACFFYWSSFFPLWIVQFIFLICYWGCFCSKTLLVGLDFESSSRLIFVVITEFW